MLTLNLYHTIWYFLSCGILFPDHLTDFTSLLMGRRIPEFETNVLNSGLRFPDSRVRLVLSLTSQLPPALETALKQRW